MLIADMLSPSMPEVDRWRQVAHYRTLPSLREILLVSTDRRWVVVQRRTADGWRVEDRIGQASLRLGVCDGPIPLEELYRDLLEPAERETPSGT